MAGEEILHSIDKNNDNAIAAQELKDFLDGKDKSFLPDEKNLQAVAKEMDVNFRGQKKEYRIDQDVLYKIHDDLTKKINDNKELTASEVKLFKLWLYIVEDKKNISFVSQKDYMKDIGGEVRQINIRYNITPIIEQQKPAKESIVYAKNIEKTFETMSLDEKTMQLQTIAKAAEIYDHYLLSKGIGTPQYDGDMSQNKVYIKEISEKIKDPSWINALTQDKIKFYMDQLFPTQLAGLPRGEQVQRSIEALQSYLLNPNGWDKKNEREKMIEVLRYLRAIDTQDGFLTSYDSGELVLSMIEGEVSESRITHTVPKGVELNTSLQSLDRILKFDTIFQEYQEAIAGCYSMSQVTRGGEMSVDNMDALIKFFEKYGLPRRGSDSATQSLRAELAKKLVEERDTLKGKEQKEKWNMKKNIMDEMLKNTKAYRDIQKKYQESIPYATGEEKIRLETLLQSCTSYIDAIEKFVVHGESLQFDGMSTAITLDDMVDVQYKNYEMIMMNQTLEKIGGYYILQSYSEATDGLFAIKSKGGSLTADEKIISMIADIKGVGGYRSDKTVNTIRQVTIEMIIQIVLMAISGGIANIAAKGVISIVEKSARTVKAVNYAERVVRYANMASKSGFFAAIKVAPELEFLAVLTEGLVFHATNTVLTEVVVIRQFDDRFREALNPFSGKESLMGYAESVAFMGIMKTFGQLTNKITQSLVGQNLNKLQTSEIFRKKMAAQTITLPGEVLSMQATSVAVSLLFGHDLQLSPEEWINTIAMVIGLRVAHMGTGSLNKIAKDIESNTKMSGVNNVENMNATLTIKGVQKDAAGKIIAVEYEIRDGKNKVIEQGTATEKEIELVINKKKEMVEKEKNTGSEKKSTIDPETVEKNAKLDNAPRLQEAEKLLGQEFVGKLINPDGEFTELGKAILEAHNQDGTIYNLNYTQLRARVEILSKAGFKPEQIRKLIESGICGKYSGDLVVDRFGKLKVDFKTCDYSDRRFVDDVLDNINKEEFGGIVGFEKFTNCSNGDIYFLLNKFEEIYSDHSRINEIKTLKSYVVDRAQKQARDLTRYTGKGVYRADLLKPSLDIEKKREQYGNKDNHTLPENNNHTLFENNNNTLSENNNTLPENIRKKIEYIKRPEVTLNDIYYEILMGMGSDKPFGDINRAADYRGDVFKNKIDIVFYNQDNKTFLENYIPKELRNNQEFVDNILFKFNLEKTRLKYVILQNYSPLYLADKDISGLVVDYDGLSKEYTDILKTELPMIENVYKTGERPEAIDYNQIKIMQKYGISNQEIEAFYRYKGVDSDDVNEFLRFGKGKKSNVVDPLLSGLDKLPNTEGTFYRFLGFSETGYNKFLQDMIEKKENKKPWSDKGIISVSSDKYINQGMSNGGAYEFYLSIESNSAKDIQFLNLNKHEKEFLIPPGKEFEVVDINKSKYGPVEIHLREINSKSTVDSETVKKAENSTSETKSTIDPEIVKSNALLSPEARIAKAEEFIGKITPVQEQAILDAHKIGSDREGAGIYNYTQTEILQKARILNDAGFTAEQRRILMENGICGERAKYKENIGGVIKMCGDTEIIDNCNACTIMLGKNKLEILKVSENLEVQTLVPGYRFNTPYVILDRALYVSSGGKRGYKGLRENEEVTLGRRYQTDRFDLSSDMTVSGEHMKISYREGKIVVEDLFSLNGTTVISKNLIVSEKIDVSSQNNSIKGLQEQIDIYEANKIDKMAVQDVKDIFADEVKDIVSKYPNIDNVLIDAVIKDGKNIYKALTGKEWSSIEVNKLLLLNELISEILSQKQKMTPGEYLQTQKQNKKNEGNENLVYLEEGHTPPEDKIIYSSEKNIISEEKIVASTKENVSSEKQAIYLDESNMVSDGIMSLDGKSDYLDFSKLEYVSEGGGSNGGKRYKDVETSKEYFVKPYENADQSRSEYVTNMIYQELGLGSPKSYMIKWKTGVFLATEKVNGSESIDNITGINAGFIADCRLANRDGTKPGNLLQGVDGTVYRIDNGGSLFFRAKGKSKASFANVEVTELTSLRDENINRFSYKYFGSITDVDIVKQVKELKEKMTDEKIKELVYKGDISNKDEVVDVLIKRRDWLVKNYDIDLSVKPEVKEIEYSEYDKETLNKIKNKESILGRLPRLKWTHRTDFATLKLILESGCIGTNKSRGNNFWGGLGAGYGDVTLIMKSDIESLPAASDVPGTIVKGKENMTYFWGNDAQGMGMDLETFSSNFGDFSKIRNSKGDNPHINAPYLMLGGQNGGTKFKNTISISMVEAIMLPAHTKNDANYNLIKSKIEKLGIKVIETGTSLSILEYAGGSIINANNPNRGDYGIQIQNELKTLYPSSSFQEASVKYLKDNGIIDVNSTKSFYEIQNDYNTIASDAGLSRYNLNSSGQFENYVSAKNFTVEQKAYFTYLIQSKYDK